MSWFSRKYTKSDWLEPVDYVQYFGGSKESVELNTWVKERLIEEQRRENAEIWEQYTKTRNINK